MVRVDLDRIRRNVEDVRQRIGRSELHAVVKADAYGLGARRIARALRDLVDGFVVFYASEAADAGLPALGKPILSLGPTDPEAGLVHGVRPTVWTVEQAAALRGARPVLSVDTGMQRFGCPPEQVEAALAAGGCAEAFTHATRVEAARELVKLLGGRGLRLGRLPLVDRRLGRCIDNGQLQLNRAVHRHVRAGIHVQVHDRRHFADRRSLRQCRHAHAGCLRL